MLWNQDHLNSTHAVVPAFVLEKRDTCLTCSLFPTCCGAFLHRRAITWLQPADLGLDGVFAKEGVEQCVSLLQD